MDDEPLSADSNRKSIDANALSTTSGDFEFIARATNDTVWHWDLRANLRRSIEGFESRLVNASGSLPVTREMWLGRIHPDDSDRVAASLDRALVSEKSLWHEEYRIRRENGDYADVLDSGSIIRDGHGQPTRMVGGTRDISERKRLIAQEQHIKQMDSIGMLAGGIAHDLNNVLLPVLLAVGLLRDAKTSAEDLKLLDTIEANLKRAANLLREILSFARDGGGQRTLVKVDRLVADISDIIEETFPRSIRIIKAVDPDLWEIYGDVAQLHQIVLNLVVNARDAMPKGGTLTLAATNVTIDSQSSTAVREGKLSPGRYVLVETSDTGVGISEEIRGRIFEPFFTTKTSGKGIGLANVHAFVKNHGGFISVESNPGHGTTFKVFLPAADQSQASVSKSVIPFGLICGNNELVLVVDDEAAILRIMQQALEASGYRVLTARNGAEAVAMYAKHLSEIALVLTDAVMPLMDGEEEIQALLRLNPATKVIVVSGLVTNAQMGAFDGLSVRHFLAKPFSVEELLQKVHSVLAEPPAS